MVRVIMASVIMAVPVAITLLTGVAIGAWTYLDAKARTAVYARTIAGIVAVFVPAVLAYLYYRDRIGPRVHDPSPVQHATGALGFAGLVSLVGATMLSPPDPVATGYYTLMLIPIGVTLGTVWTFRVAPRLWTVA